MGSADRAALAASEGLTLTGKAPTVLRVLAEGDEKLAESLSKLHELNQLVPNVLRNEVRFATGLTGMVGKLASDGFVLNYSVHDIVKQFVVEPHEEHALEHHVTQVTGQYACSAGSVP